MEGVVSLFPHSYTQFAASRYPRSGRCLKCSDSAQLSEKIRPIHDRAPRPPSVTKRKTQNINQEVSPHRAVAAVRLLRIERGGAFDDLLNVKGKNSGKNEMDYVERTLGFRTRELDNRDIGLEFTVQPIIHGLVPRDIISENGFYSWNLVKHCMDGAFATRLARPLR